MGYNIEISFNVVKNGSITELLEEVRNCAEECFCNKFYEDYECENKFQFQRRHCLMIINFSQSMINNMIEFLNIIKKYHGLYVELIFDEDNDSILYASQYFITQKMDKYTAKDFKILKKRRSYSEDENMILNAVKVKR